MKVKFILLMLTVVILVSGCISEQPKENEEGNDLQTSIGLPCPDQKVLLQSAAYEKDEQTLELIINNYGRVDLNLSVLLTINDSIVKRPEVYFVKTKEIKVVTVENVTDGLTEVMVRSITCGHAQDFRPYNDIKGLVYNP